MKSSPLFRFEDAIARPTGAWRVAGPVDGAQARRVDDLEFDTVMPGGAVEGDKLVLVAAGTYIGGAQLRISEGGETHRHCAIPRPTTTGQSGLMIRATDELQPTPVLGTWRGLWHSSGLQVRPPSNRHIVLARRSTVVRIIRRGMRSRPISRTAKTWQTLSGYPELPRRY